MPNVASGAMVENAEFRGCPAPDFSLPNQHGELVSLAVLRGRPAFLVFFPAVFSPVCDGELSGLWQQREQLAPARLIGICTDSKFSLRGYTLTTGLGLDLLSDHWPHGEISRRYGAFDEVRGTARRFSVLLDDDGLVRDAFGTGPGEPRPLSRYRQALKLLIAASERPR